VGVKELGTFVQDLTDVRSTRWYVGRVVNRNADGSYQVDIPALGVVYPHVWRVAGDDRRLTIGTVVTVRHRGLALEIIT
jgi:hypothetical protein